jgi:hypothetical protein
MKTTWLTATGKAGADLHSRQLLGYHVPKGESSALNYCRDNLAQPMEVLSSAFQAVSAGVFMPDKQRASRWPEAPLVPLPAQVEQVLGCTLDQLKQKLAGRAILASHAEGTEESTLVTIPSHPTSPSETQEQAEALPSPIASSDVFGQEDSPQNVALAPVCDREGTATPTSVAASDTDDEIAVEDDSDSDQECAEIPRSSEPYVGANFEIEIVDSMAASLSDLHGPSVAPEADREQIFQHSSRKTVHYGSSTSDSLLACKTPRSALHVRVFKDPKDLFPKCKWCFP